MTDDPRRRHLTPEEAAELRRRARERRGYADPGAPRDPAAPPGSAGRDPGARRDPAARRDQSARRDPAASRDAAARRDPGARAADAGREHPLGRTGYQPRQEPQPLTPEERARYLREDPRGGRDPRDPRDPRAGRDPRDPRDPRRSSRARAGGRDPYRQATDRRGGRPDRRSARAASAARRGRRPGRAPLWRRIGPLRIVGLVLVLVLTLGVVTALWADSKLQRIDALTDYPGRGGNTPGTVTLLVGTDSREGLTPEQQAQLSTGSESDAGGKRTDTMMLVYTPRGGDRTMLISLPRDLLVNIPGYGENKLNAAYTFGGPPLLTQTLEQQTGVRIDHYAEIGFGGFAGIVDAVGGVDICIEEPIVDPLAGLDLAAGCQTLAGPQALGFVRTRYGFAEQDLQRVRNQRQFLGALMRKTLSPGNLLNPFTAVPLLNSGAEAVTVDTGDHIWTLARVMWRLSDDPLTVTAPHDGMASGSVGSYLTWGPTTTGFFEAVAAGRTPGPEYIDAGP
ncbi:LCP family protein [Dietzia cinnamea]|uniref:LCP family protein n=1 Tax=Dietzia cinnamea TaxID=321318 RepID=UPI0021A3605D|nr:LCP family protein [Dietzia cinnamea]MCT1640865.1 LCP family protein [Dietzia cinnamea]